MPNIPEKDARLTALVKQENASAREIRDILSRAKDKTELEIIRAAKDKRFMTSARVRDTLYRDLQKEYVNLQGNVDDWTIKNATKTGRQWRKYAIEDLPSGDYSQTFTQFSRKHLKEQIEAISPTTAAKLAGVNSGQLSPQIGGMLTEDIRILRQTFVDVSRLAASTGSTYREVQKEMLQRVTDGRRAFGFIDKSGRKWDSKNYFRMLNKTVANNIARDSYSAVMVEAGHDLVTIEGGVGTYCCDPCENWAGRIVSVTGKTPDYPTVDEAKAAGVFHPNCRHYLAVVLPGEIPEAEAERARIQKEAAETRPEREAEAALKSKKQQKKTANKKKTETKVVKKEAKLAQKIPDKNMPKSIKEVNVLKIPQAGTLFNKRQSVSIDKMSSALSERGFVLGNGTPTKEGTLYFVTNPKGATVRISAKNLQKSLTK